MQNVGLMRGLALTLSIASLVLGISTLIEPRSRRTVIFAWTKFLSNAWAPHLALAGALGAVLGTLARSPVAVVVGVAGFVLSAEYVRRVTRRHDGFEGAFGADWRARIAPSTELRMLQQRWSLRAPRAPEARMTRDLSLGCIPGTTRELLADLWQPPPDTAPSGTAIVYLHGSAWTLIDKDLGTRGFFRHLAAQGHIVLDVAYRLCPETNVVGMVADAKRAVAWMKAHAAELGARPENIVLMGSSAGAHIALLAAYTPGHPQLTPDDLRDVDTSVRAVVSYYGIPDMRDYDASARRFFPPGPLPEAQPRPPMGRFARSMNRRLYGRELRPENTPPPPTHRELMRELLGGLPADVPEMADLASPIHHVSPATPPTMHLQGQHDQIAPIASARRLHRALEAAGVPALFVEYPWTGHAFDLLVPPLLGPAGQAALHDVERFIACVGGDARSLSMAGSPSADLRLFTRSA
jgi:acetyl esterase/lipase